MVQAAWPFSANLICIMSLQKHLLNHCFSLPGQITSSYLNLWTLQRQKRDRELSVNFLKCGFTTNQVYSTNIMKAKNKYYTNII